MKSITIITEDKVGLVAHITGIMADLGINIEAIDSKAVGTLGVVTLTVEKDRHADALRALANEGFDALSQETVLIKLVDKVGALAEISKRLKDANIHLQSLRLLRREGDVAIVAISCNDVDKVSEILKDELL